MKPQIITIPETGQHLNLAALFEYIKEQGSKPDEVAESVLHIIRSMTTDIPEDTNTTALSNNMNVLFAVYHIFRSMEKI